MDNKALVLCGGGGKGAFQIGAWKSLEEQGILKNVKAISGASVGALNAVLYALGDFEMAKDIWYNIESKTLLSPTYDATKGLFEREGLENILKKIELETLKHSKIQVYVSITNQDMNVEYKHINQMDRDGIISCLLASTAIPIVFDTESIEGKEYIDGGIIQLGNTPIQPLYDNGYRDVVIVALNHEFNINNVRKSPLGNNGIEFENYYPGCNITVIKPLKDLGGIVKGTLNFSQSAIRENMLEGYKVSNTVLKEERVYYMKNEFSKINLEMDRIIKRTFESAREFEQFIKTTNFSDINIEMPTMGGTIWYSNISSVFGWKVQQHKVIPSHYRILDNNNNRKAWVLNPEDLLGALIDYENSKKFGCDK